MQGLGSGVGAGPLAQQAQVGAAQLPLGLGPGSGIDARLAQQPAQEAVKRPVLALDAPGGHGIDGLPDLRVSLFQGEKHLMEGQALIAPSADAHKVFRTKLKGRGGQRRHQPLIVQRVIQHVQKGQNVRYLNEVKKLLIGV